MELDMITARLRAAHIWQPDPHGHYVEPVWCSERLFREERFYGAIFDPCAGFGRVVQAARAAGLSATAGDIVNRDCAGGLDYEGDFLHFHGLVDNVVCNPPFDLIREVIEHALQVARYKVAAILPVRRLNAAGKWLIATPLLRVWMLSPRPSMPPGSYIAAGGKVGSGTADFCWCVWSRNYVGEPSIRWLHRDGAGHE
jgi:hypothetical protein